VKLNLFVTFCPLNALFDSAAWVGFCRKFKTKLRHRSQEGANGRKYIRGRYFITVYRTYWCLLTVK